MARSVLPESRSGRKPRLARPDMRKNLKILTCTVCGKWTKGRQWWNQDDGTGICNNCAREKDLHTAITSYAYGAKGKHYLAISDEEEKKL